MVVEPVAAELDRPAELITAILALEEDHLGHPAGDAVLNEVAQRLKLGLKATIDFDLLLQRWFPLRFLDSCQEQGLVIKVNLSLNRHPLTRALASKVILPGHVIID